MNDASMGTFSRTKGRAVRVVPSYASLDMHPVSKWVKPYYSHTIPTNHTRYTVIQSPFVGSSIHVFQASSLD